MRKFISILMIVLAFMILCTSCEPTVSKKDSGGDPTPPPIPSPTYPQTITTAEKFVEVIDEMGGKDNLYVALFNQGQQKFTEDNPAPRSMMNAIFSKSENFDTLVSKGFTFKRTSENVVEIKTSNLGVWYYIYTEEGVAEVNALVIEKGGSPYPKTLDTYAKYTKALDDVLNADKTGKLIYMYATKNTPCGAELREYATPEFFATVDEAVRFDEYTVKMKMKGEPLKYVYIYNSKHYESAIDDADLMYRELN